MMIYLFSRYLQNQAEPLTAVIILGVPVKARRRYSFSRQPMSPGFIEQLQPLEIIYSRALYRVVKTKAASCRTWHIPYLKSGLGYLGSPTSSLVVSRSSLKICPPSCQNRSASPLAQPSASSSQGKVHSGQVWVRASIDILCFAVAWNILRCTCNPLAADGVYGVGMIHSFLFAFAFAYRHQMSYRKAKLAGTSAVLKKRNQFARLFRLRLWTFSQAGKYRPEPYSGIRPVRLLLHTAPIVFHTSQQSRSHSTGVLLPRKWPRLQRDMEG